MRLLGYHFTQLKSAHNQIVIKSNLSFSFAPASIESIKILEKQHGSTAEIVISFLGLFGQNAILPDHFTELLLTRAHAKDFAMRDFFDIFNQRATELFYHAWRAAHFFISYEQDKNWLKQDPSLSLVMALTGKKSNQQAQWENVWQPDALIYYSGFLANQIRTREGLQQILSDYFRLPIKIKSFLGEWLQLSGNEMTRIGKLGAHHQLGVNALLGERVWHVQNRFLVEISVDNYSAFYQLLPCFSVLKLMRQIIAEYVGLEFSFEIRVKLEKELIPACQLRNQNAFHLGWNSWLKAGCAKQNKNIVSFSNIERVGYVNS